MNAALPAHTPSEVLAAVARGSLDPVYVVVGKEAFWSERVIAALRAAVAEKDPAGLCSDVLHARETTGAAVVAAARTPPMLAPRRLVLLRDVEEFKAPNQEPLVGYLAEPLPTTCLVLAGEKIDGSTRLGRAAARHATMVKCDPPRPRDLGPFLHEQARALGVALDPGAAALLREALGADLSALAAAIERLALYAGERKRVTAEDVEATVMESRSRTVWELCDAVGRGDLALALTVVARMARDRDNPVGTVVLLGRHIRNLWALRELRVAGVPHSEIASRLGVPPFLVDGLTEQARRMKPDALRRAHRAVCEADLALKSSRLEDARVLERLVIRMIG